MKFKNLTITVGMCALLSSVASANGNQRFPNPYANPGPALSYNYLDVRAITEDFDDGGPDSEGFSIRGSVALSDSVYVLGKYEWRQLDIAGPNIEDNEAHLGLGVRFPLSDNLDLLLQGSYEWIDVQEPGFDSFDDSGLGAQAGLRVAISDALELNGHVRYRNLDELEEESYLGAGAVYEFGNGASLGGEWERSDLDTNRWGIFVRFDF